MHRFKITWIAFVGLLLSLAFIGQAHAQGTYTDIIVDGVEQGTGYFDFWGEGSSGGGCAGGIDISSTIDEQTQSGYASYPNLVQLTQQAPADQTITYTWHREITHYGLQRGGNCGPFATAVVLWPVSFAITYTENTSAVSDANGYCSQLLNCSNTSTPECPVSKIREALEGYVVCHPFHVNLIPVLNGTCLPGIASDVATGKGPCTVKTQ